MNTVKDEKKASTHFRTANVQAGRLKDFILLIQHI